MTGYHERYCVDIETDHRGRIINEDEVRAEIERIIRRHKPEDSDD